MSEYWVSQAKKFCEFCKCWIADNKPSRDFHEKGKRHQDNVKKKIEDVRKKSVADARREEEMNDSLREMEENALKALKKDLMSNPSLAAQYGVTLKPKELPQYGPQPRPKEEQELEDEQEERQKETKKEENAEKELPQSTDSEVGTWHMAVSDEGYPYYWNDITSAVSWVAPTAYLKQQGIDPETYTLPKEEGPTPVLDAATDTVGTKEEPAEKEDEEENEPAAKKVKLAEPLQLIDIPLPEDIPLPPETSKEEMEDEVKEEEKGSEEKDENDEKEDCIKSSEPRMPKSHASYGKWEQIPTEPPKVEKVDMGLPKVAEKESSVTIPVYEPKIKFREKTVSSLGAGPVFFKKPKKKMTAAQFLKKREET